MGDDFLKVAKLAVFHSECFASETTARFPEITLNQISPVHILKEQDGRVDYQFLSEVNAPNSTYLENYLAALKGFRDMRQVRILAKKRKDALALFRVNARNSSAETVISRGGIHVKPITMADGYEVHTVISTRPKGIAKLLKELGDLGEIKLLKVGNLGDEPKGNLTDKQLKALEIAMSHGYYKWPRQATLESLASKTGLSRRAFQESLRKAESKVFPKHIQDLILAKK